MTATDSVQIQARGDRVYLWISPDDDPGLAGMVDRVRRELPGVGIDWVAVREAYRFGRGRWFPVASRKADAARDQRAKIRFSADGLVGYLLLFGPKNRGTRLDEEDVLALARAYGVPEALLDRSIVRRALVRRGQPDPTPIARGRPAVDGYPARAEWRAGLPTDPEGFLWAVDQFEVLPGEILGTARRGQPVGIRHPPGRGTPGLAASGREIPARPGTDPVVLGPNLAVAPDGRTVIAQADGHLRLSGTGACRAEVFPLLTVSSAQELAEWGGTLVPASVVVEGDLEAPFPLRVLGDMEVRGSLIRSNLEVLGSLFVRDGVIQHRGTAIRTGGVLSAAFLERARVHAHTVHLRRYALKSTVSALDRVYAPGAEIRGGVVSACRGVIAGELGAPNGIVTEVAAGTAHAANAYLDLGKEWIEELRTPPSEDTPADPLALDAAVEMERRVERIREPDPLDAGITAGRVHPGVTVRVGPAVRKIENTVARVAFRYERMGPRGRVALERQ